MDAGWCQSEHLQRRTQRSNHCHECLAPTLRRRHRPAELTAAQGDLLVDIVLIQAANDFMRGSSGVLHMAAGYSNLIAASGLARTSDRPGRLRMQGFDPRSRNGPELSTRARRTGSIAGTSKPSIFGRAIRSCTRHHPPQVCQALGQEHRGWNNQGDLKAIGPGNEYNNRCQHSIYDTTAVG